MSIGTGSESPAAIKAMVDRAAERGWETVKLNGSPESVRQGWIAATAQGLKAVGHPPTTGDREAATKKRTRLQVNQDAPSPQRPGEAIARVQSAHVERVNGERRQKCDSSCPAASACGRDRKALVLVVPFRIRAAAGSTPKRSRCITSVGGRAPPGRKQRSQASGSLWRGAVP